MFCEKCGTQNPDNAHFCRGCGTQLNPAVAKNEKSMAIALILSFILAGIGIAYAGNVKKGVILFAVYLICSILGFGLPYLGIIAILLWAIALYMTYVEVEEANGRENPNILEDFKTWTPSKQIAAAVIALVIFLIVIGGVVGALTPHNTSSHTNDYSSSSGSSSSSGGGIDRYPSYSSSSGGSNKYSSSSNGHDVESHYEGDSGSADTYGTVYDDGSVESHQTGHTRYGDYQVDSYMDSNGNIHGTVDAGGHTYHVNP